LQGRSIEPQRAKGRGAGGGRSGGIKKVFVGGVDPDVTEAEIRDYFSSFGRVSSLTYMLPSAHTHSEHCALMLTVSQSEFSNVYVAQCAYSQ